MRKCIDYHKKESKHALLLQRTRSGYDPTHPAAENLSPIHILDDENEDSILAKLLPEQGFVLGQGGIYANDKNLISIVLCREIEELWQRRYLGIQDWEFMPDRNNTMGDFSEMDQRVQ